ncbi:hypothetical protein OF83DRAFT_1085912 [Amylostereum chailletii]|nr:hypothetical protein OF83DRAFT_1085912 [Amylostereum chailletii]
MHATSATLFALSAAAAVVAAPLRNVDRNVGPVQSVTALPAYNIGELTDDFTDVISRESESSLLGRQIDSTSSAALITPDCLESREFEGTLRACVYVNGSLQCRQSVNGAPATTITPQARELPNINTSDLPADSPLRHLGPGPVVLPQRRQPASFDLYNLPQAGSTVPVPPSRREPLRVSNQAANSPVRYLGPGPVVPSQSQSQKRQLQIDSIPADSPLFFGLGPAGSIAERQVVNRPFTPITYVGPVARPGPAVAAESKRQATPVARPGNSDPRLVRIVPGTDFTAPTVYGDADTAATKREMLVALLARAINDLE